MHPDIEKMLAQLKGRDDVPAGLIEEVAASQRRTEGLVKLIVRHVATDRFLFEESVKEDIDSL